MRKLLRFFIAVSFPVSILCAQEDVIIDWAASTKKLEKFPARVEPPVTITVVVKNVNDYLYSYRGSVTVDPTPATQFDIGSFAPQPSRANLNAACSAVDTAYQRIQAGVEANFKPKRNSSNKYPSVKMEASRNAWRALTPDYSYMENAREAERGCTSWQSYQSIEQSKLRSLAKTDEGSHQYAFQATLSENGKVTVTIKEYFDDEITEKGEQNFVFQTESGRFFLSVGFLATQVQARSYDVVDVGTIKGTPAVPASGDKPAVAAVDDKVIKELRIQGAGRFRPTTAVLLNYKLPVDKLLGPRLGVALSGGPVYRVAQSSSNSTASNWGIFAGASLHLWERVWLTPGFHIGEFSDLPRGFTATGGLQVPNGYPSSFSGVNRWTTRFGVGMTFRAADFKAATALVVKPAAAGSGAGNPAGKGLKEQTIPAPAAAPAESRRMLGFSPSNEQLCSSVLKAQADLENAAFEVRDAQKAQTSTLNLKAAGESTRELKKSAFDASVREQKAAADAMELARYRLSNAPANAKSAAQAASEEAQKRFQQASERVGLARAELQSAEDALQAAEVRVGSATLQLNNAKVKYDALGTALSTLRGGLAGVCSPPFR